MRVVIVESDPSIREWVLRAFSGDPAFVVVGVANRMADAEWMIDHYVPEIIICRAQETPDRQPVEPEPLFLDIRSKDQQVALRLAQCEDDLSLDRARLSNSLATIKGEVLFRKGEWLRYLVSASSTSTERTEDKLGVMPSFALQQREEVNWVRAEGNYILFHANSGTWRERGSLSMLEYDSAGKFLRISRSCAVNRSHIDRVLRQENAVFISMKCGTILRPSRSYLRAILQAIPDMIQARSC